MDELSFYLEPVPPFRLDLTVWTLRRRPHNLLDRWDGRTYRRLLTPPGQPVEVAVTQEGPSAAPRLRVQARGRETGLDTAALTGALERLLGLKADLTEFYALGDREARLTPLVQQFRGVKPPRFPTPFEALANAIACQQLSLTVGIHLLNRLAAAFGSSLPAAEAPVHAFPRPEDLAGAAPVALRALGFSLNKGRALIALAQGVTAGRVDLDGLEAMDDEAASRYLQTLWGIGRWTAEYTLLRGLGRWEVFPGDDVGARRRLEAWLHLSQPLDYGGMDRILARWRPFAGLIYFHFLLHGLAEAGHLAA